MQPTFEQVINDNQGRISYIASRYSRPDEFDDMYQEILLQLWRSFSSFKGHASIETWVYKVALNTACTFVRKEVKRKGITKSIVADEHSIAQPAQEHCQADLLNKFMNQLSDVDASILMMYLDGLSSDDIAEVLGISANATRSRVKRIKSKFEQEYVGE